MCVWTRLPKALASRGAMSCAWPSMRSRRGGCVKASRMSKASLCSSEGFKAAWMTGSATPRRKQEFRPRRVWRCVSAGRACGMPASSWMARSASSGNLVRKSATFGDRCRARARRLQRPLSFTSVASSAQPVRPVTMAWRMKGSACSFLASSRSVLVAEGSWSFPRAMAAWKRTRGEFEARSGMSVLPSVETSLSIFGNLREDLGIGVREERGECARFDFFRAQTLAEAPDGVDAGELFCLLVRRDGV